MSLSALSAGTPVGKIARLPLRFLPRDMVVPILCGPLRGKRWIVGSAIHRCWLGFYEPQKQQLVSREVRPGTVFWDVGANVGLYSLLASKLVGSGRVFAFEPVPRNLSYLRQHLALNRVANVEVLALAVSDKNGSANFQVEQTCSMGHFSAEGGLAVSMATLDSLVAEGKVLPPDCIKMDIEGAELLALRGAARTFRQFHPALFLATHGRELETQCRSLLETWGYECKKVEQRKPHPDFGEFVARFRHEPWNEDVIANVRELRNEAR
jgi:FkbM family methyltransferase